MEKINYIIFDMLTLDEFQNKISKENYVNRLNKLQNLFNNSINSINNLQIVEQVQYTPEILEKKKKEAINKNWEGLMFRKNVPYKGTRTNDLLKYKEFNEDDYKVIDIEKGEVQDVVNGIAIKIPAIGALIIEHKGNKVHVGTGLSLEQRKRWLEHPEEIIGQIINVKYFEETQDQNGNYSLRFPVLKGIYGKERNI